MTSSRVNDLERMFLSNTTSIPTPFFINFFTSVKGGQITAILGSYKSRGLHPKDPFSPPSHSTEDTFLKDIK